MNSQEFQTKYKEFRRVFRVFLLVYYIILLFLVVAQQMYPSAALEKWGSVGISTGMGLLIVYIVLDLIFYGSRAADRQNDRKNKK